MAVTSEACSRCWTLEGVRAELKVLPYSHIDTVGDVEVHHPPQDEAVCARCGAATLALNALQRFERSAALFVVRQLRQLAGGECLYARRAVGLERSTFAQMFNVDHDTTLRWETGQEPVPDTVRQELAAILERQLAQPD